MFGQGAYSFQEMEEVADWLDTLYDTDDWFWVGARDEGDINEIYWLNGEVVHASFWRPPNEPVHASGNCAYLYRNSVNLLAIYSCDAQLYLLCKAN